MCLLERQTPSFSPPGVWDSLQQYLSLNKQAIHAKQRRTACLSACCIFSGWESSEREPPQSSCFVNILCCYCISNAWLKSSIEGLEHCRCHLRGHAFSVDIKVHSKVNCTVCIKTAITLLLLWFGDAQIKLNCTELPSLPSKGSQQNSLEHSWHISL